MADFDADRRYFSELLPFYVNGTLPPEDHDWVAAYLAAHPDAQAEAAFISNLRKFTKSTTSSIPESQSLEKLLTELRRTKRRRSV